MQGSNSKDEKAIFFLNPSQDRQADIVAYRGNIVAYRGAICNQKGCVMLYWIIAN